MTAPVKLYTTHYCGFCRAAERLLNELGVPYESEDISSDHQRRAQLIAETGWRTVPIIFVGDEMVGGFMELRALSRAGRLEPLLQQAGWDAPRTDDG